jgi:competence protein ComEA
MRSRPADDRVTEITRRRLAALTAELAAARGEPPQHVADLEPAPGAPAEVPQVVGSDRGKAGRHARRTPSVLDRAAGWATDRLPPALANRPHLGSAQAGLVLVIVAAGLVLSAWWLLRAGGASGGVAAPPRPAVTVSSASAGAPSSGASPTTDGAVPGSTAAAGAASPAASGTAASAAPGDQIVVDVAGKVRRPGIAVLPAGSRVVDAVRAAGGVRPGVDRSTVNLARLLTDGEQVLIGVGPPPGGSPASGPATSSSASPGALPGSLVNINTADQTALETLPGVGPVTAQAILQWRTEHGGFTSVDELLEVSGIGDATLAKIAPYVTL